MLLLTYKQSLNVNNIRIIRIYLFVRSIYAIRSYGILYQEFDDAKLKQQNYLK
jgi:hypothetical protein